MNNTRAVVSLNGEFVLATQYGGTPTHIGLDEELILFMSRELLASFACPFEFLRRRYLK